MGRRAFDLCEFSNLNPHLLAGLTPRIGRIDNTKSRIIKLMLQSVGIFFVRYRTEGRA